MSERTDAKARDFAARFAFPVATGMWAVLAAMDGQPDRAHELMEQIRDWTPGIPGRWRPLIDSQMRFQAELHRIAVNSHRDNLDQMWSQHELAEGLRELAQEIVPASGRESAVAALDRYSSWVAKRDTAFNSGLPGQFKQPHPWTTDPLGTEPQAWAALTLTLWLCRQPQVIGDTAIRLREDILFGALRWQAAVDNRPKPEEISDHEARRLLLAAFHGDDIFEIPANPDRQRMHHLNILSVVRQWMYQHPSSTEPTAEELIGLRRRIQTDALGWPDAGPNAFSDVIDADTPPPTGEQVDAIELLGLQLLHAVITGEDATAGDVVTEIDRHGELGYRLAWRAIQDMGGMWINQMWDTARPTATLLPGVMAIIDRAVPESKRTAVKLAYTPVIAEFVETKGGELYPIPTSDVEADLWLIAAFSAWCADQPAIDPTRARDRLAGSIAYLQRADRARATDADLEQIATAQRLLHDIIPASDVARLRSLLLADGVDTNWVVRKTTQMATAARDAAAGDHNALDQVHRLNDILQQSVASLPATAKPQRSTSPQQQAERRQRERQLRNRKRKKTR
ncbi:hypothetical protein IU438_18900 [Nocardia cyriacigeorgica]|uniref:hypothetical protein n=1 Tax=Nocardia cyriacigeorgica TaxID=135487 RepID=UPI001895AEC3|nr:hypothetical protein [Nocardia cyriacigeorgica]MBF6397862.1 hypothetical protein [Nocardia cyriacigeorgica]MBF6402481.1 hypothetical protein [Nocardia cyriacigeorgica]